jgi:hypothetical protein
VVLELAIDEVEWLLTLDKVSKLIEIVLGVKVVQDGRHASACCLRSQSIPDVTNLSTFVLHFLGSSIQTCSNSHAESLITQHFRFL